MDFLLFFFFFLLCSVVFKGTFEVLLEAFGSLFIGKQGAMEREENKRESVSKNVPFGNHSFWFFSSLSLAKELFSSVYTHSSLCSFPTIETETFTLDFLLRGVLE